MAWLITKDHITSGTTSSSRVGTCSKNWKPEMEQQSTQFRLYDDDGGLYYEGLITDKAIDGDAALAFAPLDFGRADAGCTEMRYFDKQSKQWKTL